MTTWKEILTPEFEKQYYINLTTFLKEEREKKKEIYPSASDVFNAFSLTPYEKVKVVILGQDPYHGENQAHGLAFSVQKGNPLPPSLRNIFKELDEDCNDFHTVEPTEFKHGDLTEWVKQGVFLLNTVLTVEKGKPKSHAGKGWEIFTDAVIEALNNHSERLVFILWGSDARKKKSKIDASKHLILESAHPSPLSAHNGFFGSKPFSKTNEFLIENGKKPIYWFLN
jgi:uracil-DNA glycosylase